MHRLILWALVVSAGWLSTTVAFSNQEICVACDRNIVISGQFNHVRALGPTHIEGAPRRGDEAFREEIQGTNFDVTVSGLPTGKFTVQIGLVEIDYAAPGQRIFDIACGNQILANNLDIFTAAGGVGKVYFITNHVDHEEDAIQGPLMFTFAGRINTAKLNSLEILDASGRSLVYMRAADLIDDENADALKPPVVEGPEIWKDPSQPLDARVHDLVRRMSLAEKAQQMRNTAPAIPRLGIPAYDYWNEALHGVALSVLATVFPQAVAMAATFNE